MIDTSAFRRLSYGLYLVTALTKDGTKVGCVANTFQQVASNPPMASVSLNKENATTRAILETGKFAVSVLDQSATMELIGLFGFKTSAEVNKFQDVEHGLCASDAPVVLESCAATFAVEVRDRIDVGTHYLFVGPVTEANTTSSEPPMTYAYYHEVLRGKTPPKAASYVEGDSAAAESAASGLTDSAAASDGQADEADKTATGVPAPDSAEPAPQYGWRCTLCGHIEMVDELPDDFICPICGAGKDLFERIEL